MNLYMLSEFSDSLSQFVSRSVGSRSCRYKFTASKRLISPLLCRMMPIMFLSLNLFNYICECEYISSAIKDSQDVNVYLFCTNCLVLALFVLLLCAFATDPWNWLMFFQEELVSLFFALRASTTGPSTFFLNVRAVKKEWSNQTPILSVNVRTDWRTTNPS